MILSGCTVQPDNTIAFSIGSPKQSCLATSGRFVVTTYWTLLYYSIVLYDWQPTYYLLWGFGGTQQTGTFASYFSLAFLFPISCIDCIIINEWWLVLCHSHCQYRIVLRIIIYSFDTVHIHTRQCRDVYLDHVWRPGVKSDRPHSRHAQSSVNPSTVDAQKDTKVHWRPVGIYGVLLCFLNCFLFYAARLTFIPTISTNVVAIFFLQLINLLARDVFLEVARAGTTVFCHRTLEHRQWLIPPLQFRGPFIVRGSGTRAHARCCEPHLEPYSRYLLVVYILRVPIPSAAELNYMTFELLGLELRRYNYTDNFSSSTSSQLLYMTIALSQHVW